MSHATSSLTKQQLAAVRHQRKFPFDCGLRGDAPHLSLKLALLERDRHHPRAVKNVDATGEITEYTKHKMFSTHTGSHWCCSRSDSDFAKYGLGVTLYFKFTKYMAIVFCLLTILLIPNMILFYCGGANQKGVVTEMDTLSYVTIGNLGEGSTVCMDGVDGDTLQLQCPSGSVIGRIEAYYGLPRGQCACPSARKPDPDCYGTVSGDSCSPTGSYCHLENERPVLLPSGSEFLTGACCASKLVDGRADFSDLDIVRDTSCDAGSALEITRGRCLGLSSCTMNVDPSVNQTWSPNIDFGTTCDGEGSGAQMDKHGRCYASLDSEGGLATCDWSFINGAIPAGLESVSVNKHRLLIIAQCFDLNIEVFNDWKNWSKQDVAAIITLFDVLFVACFLVAYGYLRERENMTIKHERSLTAADYTLFVSSVPPHNNIHQLEVEMKRHLERLVQYAPKINHFLERVYIADINFGMNETQLLRAFIRRGKILRLLDKKQKLCALRDRQHCNSKKMEKARNAIEKVKQKLRERDKKIDALGKMQNNNRAVCAYVTFEEHEAAQRVHVVYPNSFFYWLCQPREKRLLKHRLKIEPAPEPSDINWENLEVSFGSRIFRQSVTFIATLCVLGASATAVFLIEDQKRRYQREYPEVDCSILDNLSNKTLVVRDEFYQFYPDVQQGRTGRLGCYCMSKLSVTDPSRMLNEEFIVPPNGVSEQLCRGWFETFVTVQTLTYGSAIIILFINFALRFVLKALSRFERNRSQSGELLSRAVKLFVLQLINTGAIVTLINARIDSSFEVFRRGEFRDFSQDWYNRVGLAISITMFINIFTPHLPTILKYFKQSCRRCHDRNCSRNRKWTKCTTQKQLNKLQMGPNFLLDERYAQLFNVIFVCTLYSCGIPLLIPIAAISLIMAYFVDKFFFVHVYRIPPAYDAAVAQRFTSLLPFAMVFHLLIGMWMMSNFNIFPPSNAVQAAAQSSSTDFSVIGTSDVSTVVKYLDSISDQLQIGTRLSQSHIIPMLLLLVLLLVYLILSRLLLVNMKRCLLTVCPCIRYGYGKRRFDKYIQKLQIDRDYPNYFDAIPTNVLRDVVLDHTRQVKHSLIQKYKDAWDHRNVALRKRENYQRQYEDMVKQALQKRLESATAAEEADREQQEAAMEALQRAIEIRRQAELARRREEKARLEAQISREVNQRAFRRAVRSIKHGELESMWKHEEMLRKRIDDVKQEHKLLVLHVTEVKAHQQREDILKTQQATTDLDSVLGAEHVQLVDVDEKSSVETPVCDQDAMTLVQDATVVASQKTLESTTINAVIKEDEVNSNALAPEASTGVQRVQSVSSTASSLRPHTSHTESSHGKMKFRKTLTQLKYGTSNALSSRNLSNKAKSLRSVVSAVRLAIRSGDITRLQNESNIEEGTNSFDESVPRSFLYDKLKDLEATVEDTEDMCANESETCNQRIAQKAREFKREESYAVREKYAQQLDELCTHTFTDDVSSLGTHVLPDTMSPTNNRDSISFASGSFSPVNGCGAILASPTALKNTADANQRAHRAAIEAERLDRQARELWKAAALGAQIQAPKVEEVELHQMSGLHSYDIHDSHKYLAKFGLDAEVDSQYKRRLHSSAQTHALASVSHDRTRQMRYEDIDNLIRKAV